MRAMIGRALWWFIHAALEEDAARYAGLATGGCERPMTMTEAAMKVREDDHEMDRLRYVTIPNGPFAGWIVSKREPTA